MKSFIATERILFWAPRILVILFTLFISLFTLDVFNEDYSFSEAVLALFMHLIPTFVMIIILLLAWKWELVGGVLFILLGLGYFIMVGFQRPISWYVSIAGPLILIGALFLLHRLLTGRSHAS